MASLVSRVVAFRRTEHFRRLWKYASVSIISTIVSQVVLFSTYHIWKVGSAMECNVIATAVASIPAYYLNRTWTWGKTGRSNVWREVVPFWTISFTAMVLSTGAVGIAAHNADRIASGSLARALIVNGANLLTYACIWTARYFIFNRYLFGARTQVGSGKEQVELTPEIAVPANGDAGVFAPGAPTLVVSEAVEPVRDVR
jgi:putative flippase GtrA